MAGDDMNRDRFDLAATGQAIEQQSFAIIDRELGPHSFPADQWPIVRRVIHTTGDFDFAQTIRIHPQAVALGVAALRSGARIVTDTRMIRIGLAPRRLERFGTEVLTPAVAGRTQDLAERWQITRSAAAFRSHRAQLQGSLIAVGNAPTALLEVLRLIRQEHLKPALVVGVPVGFVQAAESKDALWAGSDIPAITVLGRKGGSPVAVAILHALLDLAAAPGKATEVRGNSDGNRLQ